MRRNCEEAYPQVHKVLEAGYREVTQAIGGIGPSERRYEKWFGPPPADAGVIRDDYNGFAPALSATGENYCGMATRRSKRNLACPSGDDMHIKLGNGAVLRGTIQPAEGRNTYAGIIVHEMTHIVCETRDVKAKQAGTGRLITSKGQVSEFSSGKAAKNVPRQDNDGEFTLTYGPELCLAMARNWPDKAIMNADNYCYFCEDFL